MLSHEMVRRFGKWVDFMDPTSQTNTMYMIAVDDDPARPWPYPDQIDKRIDWAVQAYERQMERAQWLDDDFMPSVMPYTGTEIMAQAFGSPVHYSGDNMPFALPLIKDISGLRGLKQPSVFSSNLGDLFEIAERIRNRVGHDAIVQLPDIQSPLDTAALIWEKSNFLMAMIEEPEAVHEMISMVEALLSEFLDAWFKQFCTDYIAHFPSFPMRGGFTFSEDEVGEFSAEMFEEFSLPSINRLSRRYNGCAMHCCAHARHQWESFGRIEGLRLINLIPTGALIEESARFFGQTLCHFPLQGMGGETAARPIPEWTAAFGTDAHLVIQTNARDAKEARCFADQLKHYSATRVMRIT